MHDSMPYGRNQGQGQGHSREVDRQSPTGLILNVGIRLGTALDLVLVYLCLSHGVYCYSVSSKNCLLRHRSLVN